MKHPGIFIHSDTEDPTAPLWMLHLSSLTLAQVIIPAEPGPLTLWVPGQTSPPDAALERFHAVLEDMAAGASKDLVMVTRAAGSGELPELLDFAPAGDDSGCVVVLSSPLGHLLIGFTRAAGILGPIWKSDAPDTLIENRATLIEQAHKFLHEKHLVALGEESYGPEPWLSRPDTIARSARSLSSVLSAEPSLTDNPGSSPPVR